MAGYQMTDHDKNMLRSNRTFLQKNMFANDALLSCLFEVKVINEDMKEEIEVEKLKKLKISKLLDILPRRGPEAFKHFIHALMDTDQSHAARQLDESLVSEWERSHPQEEARRRTPSMPPRQPSARVQQTLFRGTSQYVDDEESGFLIPEITPIDEIDSHTGNLLKDIMNNYKMSSKPRGIALIINNTYFVHNTHRDGAAFDSQNLCDHLDKLYFTTVLHNDKDAREIKEIILDESRRPEHHDADCFLAFILSHGSQGYIYGVDGRRVSIEDDIVKPFDGNHCPALVKKPKMFFIQACQGESATEGVDAAVPSAEGDSQVDASPILTENDPEIEQAMASLRIQDKNDTFKPIKEGPAHEMSDIVLAYSTVPGYRSWRRTDLGSWFVRAVIKIFAAEAHKEDLLSLLVKVRNLVSQNKTNHEDHSFVQLTKTDETTKKKIYFFPGYYETKRGSRV